MRCINYHHYTGSKCEACILKHERKNVAQIKPLNAYERFKLRKDLVKKFEGTELEYLTEKIK